MIQTVMTNKKVTLGSCVVLGLGSLRPLSERKREQASLSEFMQEMRWNPQPLYYWQAGKLNFFVPCKQVSFPQTECSALVKA